MLPGGSSGAGNGSTAARRHPGGIGHRRGGDRHRSRAARRARAAATYVYSERARARGAARRAAA
eukprot:COSAG01_NODE_13009_length_1649_cov_4.002581_3_plen_63_part_01